MVQYDSRVIQEFADKLYKKAKSIVLSYSFFGALLAGGAGIGFSLGVATSIYFALVGCLLGFFAGHQKAFSLKLQAQIALSQVKIEQNTRGTIVKPANATPATYVSTEDEDKSI